jgi:hypothetical protein
MYSGVILHQLVISLLYPRIQHANNQQAQDNNLVLQANNHPMNDNISVQHANNQPEHDKMTQQVNNNLFQIINIY